MADCLRHRGPDDCGTWVDPAAGVGLGHRRLSILDLSPEGHQPMQSACGRYVMVYNGEVYNFRALREDLVGRGHGFRGHSDTEVILAAIAEWGLLRAVERFVGMFALAVWDRHERELSLVRDRVGIKPLYYGWANDSFFFGSELKAIRAAPRFSSVLDRDALTLYFRYNYIPTPYSIYAGIYKLPPGCALVVSGRRPDAFSPHPSEDGDGRGAPKRFWSYRRIMETVERCNVSFASATTMLDELLSDSVAGCMISDVPLGAFLSGGIDSSLVVALMQKTATRPVQTFTLGFDDAFFNESIQARAVASHLGTDHVEWMVKPEDALQRIGLLATTWDEPFADSSQVPTLLLCALARRHVTVTLSGDGGDELFAGYRRYFQCMRYWSMLQPLPGPLKRTLAAALCLTARCQGLNPLMRVLKPALPGDWTSFPTADLLRKLSHVVVAEHPLDFYRALISHWDPVDLVKGGSEVPVVLTRSEGQIRIADAVRQMMYFDTVMYHPDDILTKVDRASMSVGLETRVPLVDHRIAEFAAGLPLTYLIGGGRGKRILREVLYRYLPRSLVDHPKRGFGIPVGDWLRGPCRPWAESLLDEERLRKAGLLNVELVRSAWEQHLSGRGDHKYRLWSVLMFEAWREANPFGGGVSDETRPEFVGSFSGVSPTGTAPVACFDENGN